MTAAAYLAAARDLIERYPRRAIILACLAVAVLLAAYLRPGNIALFALPLDMAQTTEVDARLAEWGVTHTITDGNIFVESGRRNDILLRLALAGLPHPHIATSGETLAKLNALTPDSVFQAQSRAGISGDLAVALRGIEGVADASVVIAPAMTQAFSDQPQVPASAAVRLSLRPGTTLTPAAVDGIRAFVASGVPGLAPEHVAMLDDRGIALGGSSSRDDAEAARGALQSAFDQAFGAGATIVRVHVRYDADEHNEKEISLTHNEAHESVVREEVTKSAQGRPAAMAVAVLADRRAQLDLDRLPRARHCDGWPGYGARRYRRHRRRAFYPHGAGVSP